MTGQSQWQVLGGYTGTIVTDTNQFAAAGLDVDINPRGTRVQAIFKHFLGYRCRALNDFSSGNLISQPGVQQTNVGHGNVSVQLLGIVSFCPTMIFEP